MIIIIFIKDVKHLIIEEKMQEQFNLNIINKFFNNIETLNNDSFEWKCTKKICKIIILNDEYNNNYKKQCIDYFIENINKCEDGDIIYDSINDILLKQIMKTNNEDLKQYFYNTSLDKLKDNYIKEVLKSDCVGQISFGHNNERDSPTQFYIAIN